MVPLKILLVCPEFPPYNIGGGGIVYYNLAKSYKQLGYDVTVISGYYPTRSFFENIRCYFREKIKIYLIPEIPFPSKMPFLRSAMPPNLEFLKIEQIIKKEKPDIAHLHGYGLIFIDLIAMLLNNLKIPYIFTVHGIPSTPEESGGVLKQIWIVYTEFIGKKTLENARLITCVSNFISKHRFLTRFSKKIRIIYNGINKKEYKYINRINLRERYQLPKNTAILFSVGRLTKMKGFQDVITNLEKYEKKLKRSVYYLIAGEDDGYLNELKRLVEIKNLREKIIFLGKISEKQKREYIKSCDYFVVPSRSEPFGLVVLEGICLRNPPIVNNSGSLKELRTLFNLYTTKEINNINKKPKISKIRLFDWDTICLNYGKIIHEVVGHGKTGIL